MGSKTRIDWADATWNPVTGCLHGCEYCYARGIANRFGLPYAPKLGDPGMEGAKKYDSDEGMDTMLELVKPYEANGRKQPYPMGFLPTFHRYKLEEPQHWKKPRTIFVCSMADLFGEWVPDEWIKAVFDACEAAPQHRYLFLTKDPGRYCDLERAGLLPSGDNYWFGATYDHSNWPGHDGPHKIPGRPTTFEIDGKRVHDAGDFWFPGMFWKDSYKDCPEVAHGEPRNSFVSFEPLLYDIGAHIGSSGGDWLIIGAETGNRKGKAVCKREWVEHIVEYADRAGKPVFMKESLRGIMGADFRQEFPWEV
ncbi:MAG: DUF5131 family protein [Clostridia bacterium]|nr:DUF5131 family protein [Clostridia bacterium]